ncbi:MAG: disulfide bond formation protein B [Betaproteobacteria bacterium]|nr:MAG: disulfide bond formation protein B [Betaproteobacteria bacterium]
MLFALGAAAPAALLAFGYYLQYFQGQDPCPLCHVQRAFFYAVGGVFLVAALHDPARVGRVIYSVLGLLFALGGLGVAARHVWLQHLPPDKVPACGPDLFFMLENFPLGRTLQKLFAGSGQCAEVKWRFLGLSIPEWSLLCFGALAVYAIGLMLRAPRRQDA